MLVDEAGKRIRRQAFEVFLDRDWAFRYRLFESRTNGSIEDLCKMDYPRIVSSSFRNISLASKRGVHKLVMEYCCIFHQHQAI